MGPQTTAPSLRNGRGGYAWRGAPLVQGLAVRLWTVFFQDLCQVHGTLTILRYQGCETETAVNVNFCEGSCPGVSK